MAGRYIGKSAKRPFIFIFRDDGVPNTAPYLERVPGLFAKTGSSTAVHVNSKHGGPKEEEKNIPNRSKVATCAFYGLMSEIPELIPGKGENKF